MIENGELFLESLLTDDNARLSELRRQIEGDVSGAKAELRAIEAATTSETRSASWRHRSRPTGSHWRQRRR